MEFRGGSPFDVCFFSVCIYIWIQARRYPNTLISIHTYIEYNELCGENRRRF